MSRRIQELDWVETEMGVISLRRRREPVVDRDVYEVKIDDEFLMSSLFTVAETELANLALAELSGDDLSVLVGGLGLGYTARAALRDPRVSALTVIESVAPVIEWHRRDLIPDTAGIAADPRCDLRHADFFAMVEEGGPGPTYDAILLDIDHSPRQLLHPSHAAFYTPAGMRRLEAFLKPGGVFALWSDAPPDAEFERHLGDVFVEHTTHVVRFPNPLTRGFSASTVYLAQGTGPS